MYYFSLNSHMSTTKWFSSARNFVNKTEKFCANKQHFEPMPFLRRNRCSHAVADPSENGSRGGDLAREENGARIINTPTPLKISVVSAVLKL